MISFGIMSIISVSMMSMIDNLRKQLRTIATSSDFQETVGTTKLILGNPTSCLDALGGGLQVYNSTPFKIYQPGSSQNATLLTAGKVMNGWKVSSLEITNAPPAAAPTTWLAKLLLKGEKNTNQNYGSSIILHEFALNLTIDGAGKITGCNMQNSLNIVNSPISEFIYNYPAGGGWWAQSTTATCPDDSIVIACGGCIGAGCTPAVTAFFLNWFTDPPQHGIIEWYLGMPDQKSCQMIVNTSYVPPVDFTSNEVKAVHNKTFRLMARCLRL